MSRTATWPSRRHTEASTNVANRVESAEIKALLFGVVAGLVGCYRGLTVKGGPKGVGNAVNETVVYAFICLFVINVIMTAVGVRVLAR